jgi:hypothetical protein
MPAKKKKAPSKNLRELALKAARSRADLTVLLKDAYRQLDDNRELMAKGKETMREHAGVVVELNEKLADLQRQLAAKDKELERDARAFAGIDGEITFLWEEIDRFRDRLLNYIRWEMQLPEDARVALNKVRAQEFEDKLDEDAEETP